jgi:hypothetical protein
MQLAFVTSQVPLAAPASGYDIANRVVVEALRAMGVGVTSIGYAPPAAELAFEDETILLGRLDPVTAKAPMRQKLAWLAASLRHGVPFTAAKMLAVPRDRFAETFRAAGQFDGVILNSVQMPGVFLDVFHALPTIYLAHNVEHVSAVQNAEAASGRGERLLYLREARLLADIEARLVRTARHVWALSDEDRTALCAGRPGDATTLPLVSRFAPPGGRGAVDAVFDLGLVGTWTWQPNRIGLIWFLEEVVPRLSDDLTIAIAGNVGEPISCSHPGVRFLGRVPDAADFIRSVRVVPLASRGGTGVQLKTLETFEFGLPAVATSSALRGIAAVPANCTVADDAASFAEALSAKIEATRRVDEPSVDGRDFHARQLRHMTAALRRGLDALT